MEKHIFKFGSSSHAIILPKKWLEKNGLKDSNIFVDENNKVCGQIGNIKSHR
jgi:hypothetical protein